MAICYLFTALHGKRKRDLFVYASWPPFRFSFFVCMYTLQGSVYRTLVIQWNFWSMTFAFGGWLLRFEKSIWEMTSSSYFFWFINVLCVGLTCGVWVIGVLKRKWVLFCFRNLYCGIWLWFGDCSGLISMQIMGLTV